MTTASLTPHITRTWPSLYPRSRHAHCFFNDQPLDLLHTQSAEILIIESNVVGTLRLHCAHEPKQVRVTPLALGIEAQVQGYEIVIPVQMPQNLCIEIDNLPRMYVFASAPSERPQKADAKTHVIPAGQIVELESLILKSGESLYVEYGGVLRGAVRAYGAEHIRIYGAGIIDGGYHQRGTATHQHLIRYENSRHIQVDDVTLINSCTWTHVLFGCQFAQINNVHQIGHGGGNDGIDVMSSSDVRIQGGFIHSGDDCIVVKAQCKESGSQRIDGVDRRLVCFGKSERIYADGCILMNDGGGNAVEIGHELRCERVGDISFTNIDILGCHGHGAVFSVHNCDRAIVEDVLYENIRVEHHYDKLLSMRITKSRYHFDQEYGHIRKIQFKNIKIVESPYNPGYTCSVMGGHDESAMISDVSFENVQLGERVLSSLDDFDCYHKHTQRVTFKMTADS